MPFYVAILGAWRPHACPCPFSPCLPAPPASHAFDVVLHVALLDVTFLRRISKKILILGEGQGLDKTPCVGCGTSFEVRVMRCAGFGGENGGGYGGSREMDT